MGVIQYAKFLPVLAASDPLAGYLVYDTFADVDGTDLATHLPDKRPGGNLWLPLRGAWQNQGNRGKLTASGGDGQNVVVIDAGAADVTVREQLVTDPAGDTDSGLIVNAADADNYWLFTLLAGTCVLYEHTSGGFTPRGGGASFGYVAGNTYDVVVVADGDAIACYIDGAAKQSYSVAGRPHKTATRHGLRTYVADTHSAHDTFSVAL